MKKLIIGICAFILAISISICSFFNLLRICKNTFAIGNQVISSVSSNNETEIENNISTFLESYHHSRKWLGIYLNHNEIEELDILFYEIENDLKRKEFENLQDTVQEILYYFRHIKESEYPSIENIL